MRLMEFNRRIVQIWDLTTSEKVLMDVHHRHLNRPTNSEVSYKML